MARRPHRILQHGDPEELAPGLWSVTGSLPIPLRRNMVIYRLADGTLLLHSVVAMNDAGMAKLDALGKPSIVIVPNTGHRLDAPFYKERYPNVRIVCPVEIRAKVEEKVAVDATAEEALPPLGVRPHALPGYKGGELAYEVTVPGGKGLLMADAVANSDYSPSLVGKLMAAISGGIKGRLGVARIVKLAMMRNKETARADLNRLADIPDLRILVPCHGRPLLDGCSEALREAAASI